MDPIECFVLFMRQTRVQMIAYLEHHQGVDVGYFSRCVIPTIVDTCHQRIDRREGYILTGRKGTPRKESLPGRDIPHLYERLRRLYDLAGERSHHVDELIDDMQICVELAVECFQLGTTVWDQRIQAEKEATAA